MEDIGPLPIESKTVELWIHRQLKNGEPTSNIADELIKRWEKGQFELAAKFVVGQFCFLNGFYLPIIRVLKQDLARAVPLPWGLVARLFLRAKILDGESSKSLVDSMMVGGTRDKSLYSLAAEALRQKNKDPRWPKVLDDELNERYQEAMTKRSRLFEEVAIFKQERMSTDLKETLHKILKLFPEDREAKALLQQFSELDLEASLSNLRKEHERRKAPRSLQEETPQWPGIQTAVDKVKMKLDPDSGYNFAIGLHQMGLNDLALSVLRVHSHQWTLREQSLELQILLEQRAFAEALDKAQKLMPAYPENADVICECLYVSAKAYYGMEDQEQAISILRGLVEHQPQYRDAALLLAEWVREL